MFLTDFLEKEQKRLTMKDQTLFHQKQLSPLHKTYANLLMQFCRLFPGSSMLVAKTG